MSNGDRVPSPGVEEQPGGPDMMVNIGSLRCAQTGRLEAGQCIRWKVLDANLNPVKRFVVLPARWETSPLETGVAPIVGKDGETAPVRVTAQAGRKRTVYKFAIRTGGPNGPVHTSKEAYLVIWHK